jgi:hypothetical protein
VRRTRGDVGCGGKALTELRRETVKRKHVSGWLLRRESHVEGLLLVEVKLTTASSVGHLPRSHVHGSLQLRPVRFLLPVSVKTPFAHFPPSLPSYSSSPSSPSSTQLLERCAVGDFTIKDLTAPTAKRFQANLSGILNFYFFEQDQGDRVLRPLEDEVEHLAAEEEGLITENAELRERIEQEKCVFLSFFFLSFSSGLC